ncbi:MAG TPA: glycosyltransferase family protein [Candidatus Gracilibacteria bacterium]
MNIWNIKKPKILYGIQTTGCGHLGRALEMVPKLQKRAHVDVVLSGPENDFELPFEVQYRFKGLGFILGRGGNIDYLQTLLDASLPKIYSEGRTLPVKDYDLVITDFEPISAWAAKINKVPCIGFGNQYAFAHKNSFFYQRSQQLHRFFIQFFAPCHRSIAIDYKTEKPDLFSPIIRSQIRSIIPSEGRHYTVYLNAYNVEEVEAVLMGFPQISWHVFSSRIKTKSQKGLITYFPINQSCFVESVASCRGVITGAGFSSTSETLFLKKKLLVVPTKLQFEQKANARVLRKMGVNVIPNFTKRYTNAIKYWLEEALPLEVDYPENTDQLIDRIFELVEEVRADLQKK